MSLPLRPLSDLQRRDIAFWLPPGGHDNGVFAAYWGELADLEAGDVEPLLAELADAGVGAYIGTPGGRRSRGVHRLWVDSLQYHRAEDVLVGYVRGRR